jgi:hypothetical protein
MPTVVTKRIIGVSLEAVAKSITNGPRYVRVGLPDSEEAKEKP